MFVSTRSQPLNTARQNRFRHEAPGQLFVTIFMSSL
jgi:hypothetical protein